MQVDLKENAAALSEAYASVRNGTGLNWALFTYGGKGKENLLVVAGTGDGGLSELKEEFNDGKIMYAFARVIDDNSNLPKFVLISWVGGGVPENKKGLVNTHINEIKKLLVGFHVQINARSETDVEPANIQQKVRDASGAKFSVQQKNEKPAAPAEKPEPVGTRYEKPVIIGRQVPVPQDEPPVKAPAPTPNRLPATVPRAAPAAATYSAPPPAAAVYSAPPPASAPRAAPARPGPPAPVPRAAPVVDNRAQIEAEERRKQEEERRQQEQRERQERERREQQEREQEAAAAAAAASKPATGGSSLTATVIYDYQAAEANELNLNPGDIITGIEQIDEGWWQGYDPAGNFGLFPSSYVQANEGDVAAAEPVAAYEEEQTVNTGGQGITARSIYDYQAGDDNELSFDVNEIITEIEMIDEGWWRGRNQAGAFGLFPANYVEQI